MISFADNDFPYVFDTQEMVHKMRYRGSLTLNLLQQNTHFGHNKGGSIANSVEIRMHQKTT